jgi:hypothetical protein
MGKARLFAKTAQSDRNVVFLRKRSNQRISFLFFRGVLRECIPIPLKLTDPSQKQLKDDDRAELMRFFARTVQDNSTE